MNNPLGGDSPEAIEAAALEAAKVIEAAGFNAADMYPTEFSLPELYDDVMLLTWRVDALENEKRVDKENFDSKIRKLEMRLSHIANVNRLKDI